MVSIPNIHSDFDIDPEYVCHTDLLSLDYRTFTANKHAGEQRDEMMRSGERIVVLSNG